MFMLQNIYIMRNLNIFKFSIIIISLMLLSSCAEKREQKENEQKDAAQIEEGISNDTNDSGNMKSQEEKTVRPKMSPEEAEVLDMKITEYERNSEDLINWSKIADDVRNVNEANAAMMEYLEVQKRFNENIKEIEKKAVEMLGEDHQYSAEYESHIKGYMNDPERTNKAKRIVNNTMRLIEQYGDDPVFMDIMKQLEEMNKHRMKELQENRK